MIEVTTMTTTLASVYISGVEEGAVRRYEYSIVEEKAIGYKVKPRKPGKFRPQHWNTSGLAGDNINDGPLGGISR